MEIQELVRDLVNNFSNEVLSRILYRKNENFSRDSKEYDIGDFGHEFKEMFNNPYKLGDVKLDDGNEFVVFSTEVKVDFRERGSKKKEFRLAKSILRQERGDAGFFVFHKNGAFRFWLVYLVYRGTKREFRYGGPYYVHKGGGNQVFEKALMDLKFDTLDNIKSVFPVQLDVEDFFEEIQDWYVRALKDKKVKFPGGRKEENLVRLMTRLIFVWFLKEKGLVPEIVFDERELSKIVKNFGKGSNYYNAILQNLFFGALNAPINERRFVKDEKELEIDTLYRYQNLLNISEEEFVKIFSRVPFIGGSLFECLDENGVYVDGFSENSEKRASIPDHLFFDYGEGETKVRGIISILKDYNFTPNVEILLSSKFFDSIYKNLLASTSEVQSSEEKEIDPYYTPREVVEFMVEEALIEYFKDKVGVDEGKIRSLLSYGEVVPEFTKDEKERIVKAVSEVKILDPTVGSGNFLINVVHKLVDVLRKVDSSNEMWKKVVMDSEYEPLERIKKTIVEVGITDGGIKREIDKTFDKIKKKIDEIFLKNPDYARKFYIIKNSIYGVDTQNIAIQICKLRFFLSLLMDQKMDGSKENFGIEPLPHLETNFVCANTLVKLEKLKQDQDVLEDSRLGEYRDELRRLYKGYFSIISISRNEKKELMERVREKKEEIRGILNSVFSSESVEKIVKFDIFDQNARADWFDPEWMFGIEGFDIVIGKPLHMKRRDYRSIENILRNNYPYIFDGRADLYVFFFARGYELLKDGGVLVYTTSNRWLKVKYGTNMRRFFRDNARIEYLVNIWGNKVFEKFANSCIAVIRKAKEKNPNLKVAFIDDVSKDKDVKSVIREKTFTIDQGKLREQVYLLVDEETVKLKDKMERVGKPLKDWNVKINIGVVTGFNDAFIIKDDKRQEILNDCKSEEERIRTEKIIKPVLTAEDIVRYYCRWNGKWLIGTFQVLKLDIKDYPAIRRHLCEKLFEKLLEKYDIRRSGWFETASSVAYYREFEREKIVWRVVADSPTFAFDSGKNYVESSGFIITGENLKYILGLLNSSTSFFYIKLIAPSVSTNFEWGKQYVERIPIPPITSQNEGIVKQIEDLVDQVLDLKSKDPSTDTTNLERDIDRLVYELYGFTEDEIKIIEENRWKK